MASIWQTHADVPWQNVAAANKEPHVDRQQKRSCALVRLERNMSESPAKRITLDQRQRTLVSL